MGYYNAFDHEAWDAAGLKDFGDFAECVEYVNQEEDYFDSLRGQWYYGDDESRTIYYGTFANDHCPGADCYTRAYQFATEEEYREELATWEAFPEYLEVEEEEEEE